ncbi:MAG: transcriptional regulator, partial [Allorhizobium sp.]
AIRAEDEALTLTAEGETLLAGQGLDIASLRAKRRPLCRGCLDWSERRTHLAGSLGAALLSHFLDRGHARRVEESRIIRFSPEGERRFLAMFPAAD